MKKPPSKPHFKTWLLAAVAATGLGITGQAYLGESPKPAALEESSTTLIIGNELSAEFNRSNGRVTGHQALLPAQTAMSGNDFLRMNDDQLLRSAALLGERDIVEYLVSKGADIHAKNEEALRVSVAGGHFDVAQYLVSKGARADQKIINDAELIESTADLAMPMTKALQSTLALPGGHP